MSLKQSIGSLLRRLGLMPLADLVRYRLTAWRAQQANRAFIAAHLDLALPEPYMIYETFRLDFARYYRSGRADAEWIRNEAAAFIRLDGLDILDWGCGPGRVIRHLPNVVGGSCRYYGTDYNPAYVDWCSRHLPGIRFEQNSLQPPLPFAAASMDLVYSISILTHLSEKGHAEWLAEMHRVLRPGGLFITTTHGDITVANLLPAEAAQYRRGELVMRERAREGHRMYAAYQPPAFMEKIAAGRFRVLKHRPGRAQDWGLEQDVWILQKI